MFMFWFNVILTMMLTLLTVTTVHHLIRTALAPLFGFKLNIFSFGSGPLLASFSSSLRTHWNIRAVPLYSTSKLQIAKSGLSKTGIFIRYVTLTALTTAAMFAVSLSLAFSVFSTYGIYTFKPVISKVRENTDASANKFEKGDQIIAVNGVGAQNVIQALHHMDTADKAKRPITLGILRNGQQLSLPLNKSPNKRTPGNSFRFSIDDKSAVMQKIPASKALIVSVNHVKNLAIRAHGFLSPFVPADIKYVKLVLPFPPIELDGKSEVPVTVQLALFGTLAFVLLGIVWLLLLPLGVLIGLAFGPTPNKGATVH